MMTNSAAWQGRLSPLLPLMCEVAPSHHHYRTSNHHIPFLSSLVSKRYAELCKLQLRRGRLASRRTPTRPFVSASVVVRICKDSPHRGENISRMSQEKRPTNDTEGMKGKMKKPRKREQPEVKQ